MKRSQITTAIDGEKWLFTNRQKTDSPTRLPLLPKALEIMEKYSQHPQCCNDGSLLPVLSNQKMNFYLKEIADMCGITGEFGVIDHRNSEIKDMPLRSELTSLTK